MPQKSIFTYSWRHPKAYTPSVEDSAEASVRMGDEVWVKPPNVRCTSQWNRGRVSGINSDNNVEVDGVNRHILDIRPVVGELDGGDDGEGDEVVLRRYPQRERRPPEWYGDPVGH